MRSLKRIHFADCGMTSEQAIALAEIMPEVPGLAHISFMENPDISRLTEATTEEGQEEACALFASLLAATRLSSSLVCVDIEVPAETSSDLVKALAKQVVAYCLRNLERLPVSELAAVALAHGGLSTPPEPEYPDVLQHLVGHDVTSPSDFDSDVDTAPDDDYVIGGTGIVKALSCCLENRGDESRRPSAEFSREVETGTVTPSRTRLPAGKAKDMSKHLLLSARKIRLRLQPAIIKAKVASDDTHAYRKSLTVAAIIGTLANSLRPPPLPRQHPKRHHQTLRRRIPRHPRSLFQPHFPRPLRTRQPTRRILHLQRGPGRIHPAHSRLRQRRRTLHHQTTPIPHKQHGIHLLPRPGRRRRPHPPGGPQIPL